MTFQTFPRSARRTRLEADAAVLRVIQRLGVAALSEVADDLKRSSSYVHRVLHRLTVRGLLIVESDPEPRMGRPRYLYRRNVMRQLPADLRQLVNNGNGTDTERSSDGS